MDSANTNILEIATNGANYLFRCNNAEIGFILLQQSNKNFAIFDIYLDNSKGSMQLVIKAKCDGSLNEYRFNPST